jgi:hypothetical protein
LYFVWASALAAASIRRGGSGIAKRDSRGRAADELGDLDEEQQLARLPPVLKCRCIVAIHLWAALGDADYEEGAAGSVHGAQADGEEEAEEGSTKDEVAKNLVGRQLCKEFPGYGWWEGWVERKCSGGAGDRYLVRYSDDSSERLSAKKILPYLYPIGTKGAAKGCTKHSQKIRVRKRTKRRAQLGSSASILVGASSDAGTAPCGAIESTAAESSPADVPTSKMVERQRQMLINFVRCALDLLSKSNAYNEILGGILNAGVTKELLGVMETTMAEEAKAQAEAEAEAAMEGHEQETLVRQGAAQGMGQNTSQSLVLVPMAEASAGSEAEVEKGLGCACKTLGCIKKFCRCFSAGLACGTKCKCKNCKNPTVAMGTATAERDLTQDSVAQTGPASRVPLVPGTSTTMLDLEKRLKQGAAAVLKGMPPIAMLPRGTWDDALPVAHQLAAAALEFDVEPRRRCKRRKKRLEKEASWAAPGNGSNVKPSLY